MTRIFLAPPGGPVMEVRRCRQEASLLDSERKENEASIRHGRHPWTDKTEAVAPGAVSCPNGTIPLLRVRSDDFPADFEDNSDTESYEATPTSSPIDSHETLPAVFSATGDTKTQVPAGAGNQVNSAEVLQQDLGKLDQEISRLKSENERLAAELGRSVLTQRAVNSEASLVNTLHESHIRVGLLKTRLKEALEGKFEAVTLAKQMGEQASLMQSKIDEYEDLCQRFKTQNANLETHFEDALSKALTLQDHLQDERKRSKELTAQLAIQLEEVAASKKRNSELRRLLLENRSTHFATVHELGEASGTIGSLKSQLDETKEKIRQSEQRQQASGFGHRSSSQQKVIAHPPLSERIAEENQKHMEAIFKLREAVSTFEGKIEPQADEEAWKPYFDGPHWAVSTDDEPLQSQLKRMKDRCERLFSQIRAWKKETGTQSESLGESSSHSEDCGPDTSRLYPATLGDWSTGIAMRMFAA